MRPFYSQLGFLILLVSSGISDTASQPKPYAYLFSADLSEIIAQLQMNGVKLEEFREDMELDVEVDRVEGEARESDLAGLKTTTRVEARRLPTGTILLKTDQPKGALAADLLEPNSKKYLLGRDLPEFLKSQKDIPVFRLTKPVPITSCAVRPPEERRTRNQPITYDQIYNSSRPLRFGGSPVRGLRWLKDGEHFLQVKEGRLWKVNAASGRISPFFNADSVADRLSRLPVLDEKTARQIASRTSFSMDPSEEGALLEYQNDLYYFTFDGKVAVRLTSTPQREELPAFSPDGKFVAFVRQNDLWVVDLQTRTERALTTGGTDKLRSGKADWVYFEEVFHRNWRTYWWSPDSRRIAFLRIDSSPVREFTVVNNVPHRQVIEETPFPKPGEPNPRIDLGIVTVAGGPVSWADLSGYDPENSLITGAGWWPDGGRLYFYIQNRTQTWLDISTLDTGSSIPGRLFRETTGAWVDPPPEPHFLKNHGFLWTSERTGWWHVYHIAEDGQIKGALTSGEWEVRAVHHLDETDGWLYFTGTRDSPIAENLYRARIDGSKVERLTKLPGHHGVQLSPNGKYFIDTWSSHKTPTQVALYRSDGSRARLIDTNPVYQIEEYRFGSLELFQIETTDGFLLEAALIKPPDFDPSRRYPVWFSTYAGPRAPTIRDVWMGGRTWDQVLAQSGFLVFHCDPRSASGKGGTSAWTAYRQLGVQELKDIEEAIRWLTSKPYVDASRIGITGMSYGGFMTAYAMTHSKLFAAGIAGAAVTDWRDYDSIYTERYMMTPQENLEGYEATSVVGAAKNLHGRLLLIHGAIDDNVHFQHALRLVDALTRANKKFDLIIYPSARHGFWGKHYRETTYQFILQTLGSPLRRRF